jgi:hypothetical protein
MIAPLRACVLAPRSLSPPGRVSVSLGTPALEPSGVSPGGVFQYVCTDAADLDPVPARWPLSRSALASGSRWTLARKASARQGR